MHDIAVHLQNTKTPQKQGYLIAKVDHFLRMKTKRLSETGTIIQQYANSLKLLLNHTKFLSLLACQCYSQLRRELMLTNSCMKRFFSSMCNTHLIMATLTIRYFSHRLINYASAIKSLA